MQTSSVKNSFNKSSLNLKNVYLAGFMGAGKSTVGPLLAQQLGWTFLDTDCEIENRSKMTPSEIVQQKGESYFRDLESDLMSEISTYSQYVVALGGGSLIRQANFDRLNTSGLLVYLKAELQTLEGRLQSGLEQRPLLFGLEKEALREKIQYLLLQRKKIYESCHFQIETDALAPYKIAHQLAEIWVKAYESETSKCESN